MRRNITQYKCFIIPKKYLDLKKEKLDAILIFKTNNANPAFLENYSVVASRVTTNDIRYSIFGHIPPHKFPAQNHIPWSYSPLRSYSPHTTVIRL